MLRSIEKVKQRMIRLKRLIVACKTKAEITKCLNDCELRCNVKFVQSNTNTPNNRISNAIIKTLTSQNGNFSSKAI